MDPALATFASLIGNCYAATIAPGTEDTHCFRDMFDGAHVRDTHVVTKDDMAVYQGETIYSETPDGIVFTYANSDGGVGQGKARFEGGAIMFEMSMHATGRAPALPIHSRWVIGANGYDVTAEGKAAIHYGPAR